MALLKDFLSALRTGSIEVVDLTAPLSSATPILALPEQFGQTLPFRLDQISRYDDLGPAWYWNNISTGEHTGTHFDAPIHWVTGQDNVDVGQVPVGHLFGAAAVIDVVPQVAADPNFLLDIEHIEAWEREHGALPADGWLLIRTGWDARSNDADAFANNGATPGVSPDCARWLAEKAPIRGVGVETVGTDAGAAHSFDPPFPCHSFLLGAGKYGLTQLQNLALLPPTGAIVVAAPLPIVGGSGSPARVLALVER
jgi:kynurenine formamidase